MLSLPVCWHGAASFKCGLTNKRGNLKNMKLNRSNIPCDIILKPAVHCSREIVQNQGCIALQGNKEIIKQPFKSNCGKVLTVLRLRSCKYSDFVCFSQTSAVVLSLLRKSIILGDVADLKKIYDIFCPPSFFVVRHPNLTHDDFIN